VGTPFSFPVTTTGVPAPSIGKEGKLPAHVKVVNAGGGQGTIVGTPTKSGVYHFTITATFGKGTTKSVVTQSFILTVDPAA